MTDRQYDLMIAYYGSEKNGSQKQARALYDELQGATLWKGKQLNVYFHPATDPTGSYATTPIVIQKTPLFLFVVESNPPVDPYGFIVSRDKNGQTRRIYEEIQAEQESRFYRINPAHAAKLYVCDGYSMEAAAQLHPIFNGKNHFSEEDGTLPVLQWAKEQLKEMEEKGIFPVRAKNGEPQSPTQGGVSEELFEQMRQRVVNLQEELQSRPTQGGVSEEMFEQMRQRVVSLQEELQSRPTQGGVSEEQFEKMREENVRLQEELKKIEAQQKAEEEERRKAEEEERRKAEEDATLEKSFAFGYYKEGYTVESFFGKETEVVIPSTYKGEPVLKIGERAFYERSRVKKVTIPDSVYEIEEYAFYSCTDLESVSCDGVCEIGQYAFYDCKSLTSIETADIWQIGQCAFYGCKSLTSHITLDAPEIQEATFRGCESLKGITLLDGVTHIGEDAFTWCSSLKSITIPNSVIAIWLGAFRCCSSLESITVDADNPEYLSIDGNLYTKDGKRLLQYAIGKQEEAFSVPDGVITVDNGAFWGCSRLTSITLPGSVTHIREDAFCGCSSLTSITIPRSVTTIGEWAFSGCSSLTSIFIKNGVTTIGKSAFAVCDSLTNITIPRSVTAIGEGVFSWCSSLESITVEADNPKYQSIDGNLYSKDGKVLIQYAIGKKDESFTIPRSVTAIGESAFLGCSGLESIEIPEGVTSIGADAFSDCESLVRIKIPNSVTTIGEGAFSWCSSLESITVESDNPKYQSIDGNLYTKGGKVLIQYAFGKKDESFTIPSSVTAIGEWAFEACSSLTSITIPNSVTAIGEWAFEACSSLKIITIPSSVTTIGESTFLRCSSLESITVDADNPEYLSIDGNLYTKDGKVLIQYAIGKKDESFTIPSSITTIGTRAFEGCENLKAITIPRSVTAIGWRAFEGCKALTSVTFDSPGGWFYASSVEDFEARKNGKAIDFSNPTANKKILTGTHFFYAFYRT